MRSRHIWGAFAGFLLAGLLGISDARANQGWRDLGGDVVGTPECVIYRGKVQCFLRSTGSSLHQFYTERRTPRWIDLGGTIAGAPSCVVERGSNIHCFVRGQNGRLQQRWFRHRHGWQAWVDLGRESGFMRNDPECVSWGSNRIDCFHDTNGLVHSWWDGRNWQGPENLGGDLAGAPDCVSWGANRIDCFARSAGNALVQRWWDGSAWRGWKSLGGQLTGDPDCVSWGENRIDCFAAGGNGALWHRYWDGKAWRDWESLGGDIAGKPACVAEVERQNTANRFVGCAVRFKDNTIRKRHYSTRTRQWTDWTHMGGPFSNAPACAAAGGSCFITGFDRTLYYRY